MSKLLCTIHNSQACSLYHFILTCSMYGLHKQWYGCPPLKLHLNHITHRLQTDLKSGETEYNSK